MDSIIILIIVIIAFIIFINVVCSICKPPQISGFTATVNELGYASDTDPYDKPFILEKFLTTDQCQRIVERADGKLIDSEVVGGKNKTVRNSKQYWIPKTDPLVRPMFEKVSKMFNIPFENAEDLQVVRYLPGQYFNEHHDACCDDNERCKDFVNRGGQRKLTILIYLNNEFDDGKTYFRNLDLKVKPPTGDAVVFYPLAKGTSKCHPYSLHAGMPVSRGAKWVANLWFRERPFSY